MASSGADHIILYGAAAAVFALAILRPDPYEGAAGTPAISAPRGLPTALPAAPDTSGDAGPAATGTPAPTSAATVDADGTTETDTDTDTSTATGADNGQTATQSAVETAPPEAVTTATEHGLDVSHYQGSIDWSTVANAGIAFVYAKATEGLTYVDPRFAQNAEGAPAAGLDFGAYHFFEPKDDAVSQAQHFLKIAAPGSGDLPPVLDLEVAASSGETDLADAALAWLSHVEEQTGCRPKVYASPSFYTANLGSALSEYPLYLAEYSKTPKPPAQSGPLVLWQYSQYGSVAGISGHVDLDLREATEVTRCP